MDSMNRLRNSIQAGALRGPAAERLSRGTARKARFLPAGTLALPLAGLFMLFFVLPPVALVFRWISFGAPGAGAVSTRSIVDATLLSLGTTAISMLIVVVFGTALAYLLSQGRFPFFRFFSVFVELPIVMPPAVAGLALLMAFGRQGLLAGVLPNAGIRVTFTPLAVILAQLFVASPYYIRAAQARFSAIPRELYDAAGLDGASFFRTFWHVTLPLSQRALLAALTLTWSRALGEFGATILVAGNLPRKTQTMTLLVYSALERDLHASFTVAILLLAMAAVALGTVRYLARLDRAEENT
jgi:molybdate transport system permease protein